jgi:4-hydroxybenzoate polyprenyltransferase
VSAARGSLLSRFGRYQAVRFPLAGFVPLLTLFAFSSAAYSRLARAAPGFVPWPRFLVGAFTTVTCFFLLRVLDEHKDEEIDARSRPELPVPSGVITLAELRAIGGGAFTLALALNALVAPVLLLPLALSATWAFLMTREFFVRDWLRAHAAIYLLTHMAILPLLDGYTTGLDWLVEGARPPHGLLPFLAVTFCNGILIEIGRKTKAPASERAGVDSYSRAWGVRAAPLAWLTTLVLSALAAAVAAHAVGLGAWAYVVLALAAAASALPAAAFLRRANPQAASAMDRVSSAWPCVTYVVLGSGPFLARLAQAMR